MTMKPQTMRVIFAPGTTLVERNEAFRQALIRFEKGPSVVLLREGYIPLPLDEAGNADVMFCEALEITGQLRPSMVVLR